MAENFIAEAFSLLAIALVVISLRWWSRLMTVGFRKLAVDDYLMVVAGVSSPAWRRLIGNCAGNTEQLRGYMQQKPRRLIMLE